MKESIKKITVLVASLLTALGLAEWAEVVNYISDNIEVVFTAITATIAIITALYVKVQDAIDGDDNDVDPILN